MVSIINKRQQARNEKALQDLVNSVAGNEKCADCFAKNPSWASWSLGCFLCMRCASVHRKLGTHISKVKSLSMDTWAIDQVEHMKRNGNLVVNKEYNPRNIKPRIPLDSEDVDAAIERYIRDKYQNRNLGQIRPQNTAMRHNTGSSSSTEDIPPAVPPKNDNFSWKGTLAKASRLSRVPDREPYGRKQDFEVKLAQLRDMGFPNEERNGTVLKGVNGDMTKAIDALVRLGEGGDVSRVRAQVEQQRTESPSAIQQTRQHQQQPSQAASQQQIDPPHQHVQTQQRSATMPLPQSNWATQDQFSQSSASSQVSTPTLPRNNPFYVSTPQQPSFEQVFGGMSISQAPAPLMQHNTGIYNGNFNSSNPFMRNFTPPTTPPIQTQGPYNPPSQYYQPQQPLSAQPTGIPQTNPFLRSTRSQNFATPRDLYDNSSYGFQQYPQGHAVPYNNGMTPAVPALPGWVQEHRNSSQPVYMGQDSNSTLYGQGFNYVQSPLAQSPAAVDASGAPAFDTAFQQANAMSTYPPGNLPASMQNWQGGAAANSGMNKASILALFNQPAPQFSQQESSRQQQQEVQQQQQQQQMYAQQPQQGYYEGSTLNGQRPGEIQSTTQAASHNPFAGLNKQVNQVRQVRQHISNDSVEFTGWMKSSGRHSPDAFNGLSARVR